jgi:hypothetical protein
MENSVNEIFLIIYKGKGTAITNETFKLNTMCITLGIRTIFHSSSV